MFDSSAGRYVKPSERELNELELKHIQKTKRRQELTIERKAKLDEYKSKLESILRSKERFNHRVEYRL